MSVIGLSGTPRVRLEDNDEGGVDLRLTFDGTVVFVMAPSVVEVRDLAEKILDAARKFSHKRLADEADMPATFKQL